MMIPIKYPKIQTLWKRDEKNKFRIIEGDYSKEEFKNIKKWLITEKIDGTNIRIYFDGELHFIEFGGRTNKAEIPKFLLDYLNEKFTVELLEPEFKDSKTVVLFGEGYGGYIQSAGKKYRKDISFILFDVWIDGWWLERESVEEIANKLKIGCVPVLGVMTEEEVIKLIKEGMRSKMAQEDLTIEGIVARSYPLMLYRNGKPLMFKLKIKDYVVD